MKIEYEEINGLLYPKLALTISKRNPFNKIWQKKITVFKAVSPNCLYKSINKW